MIGRTNSNGGGGGTTITFDLYSAANDTVYYMDNGSPVTLCTTDLTGKATGVSLTIPRGGKTLTLYSTIANKLDLSEKYSQSVTLTDSTNTVNFIPNNVLYWYGNKCKHMPLGGIDGINTLGYVFTNQGVAMPSYDPIFNTNYIQMIGHGGSTITGIGTVTVIDITNFSSIKAYITDITETSGRVWGYLMASTNKSNTGDVAHELAISPITTVSTSQVTGNVYITDTEQAFNTSSHKTHAIWLE